MNETERQTANGEACIEPGEHERLGQRVAAMIEVGHALTAVRDIDELLKLVAERVTEVMGAERSSIFLIDALSSQIWSKVVQGEEVFEIRMGLGQGLSGWVAQTGKTINLKDAYQDSRFNPKVDKITGFRTGSVLVSALPGKQGKILGVIQTLNKRSGAFSVDDERLLEAVCSQVGIALEHAALVHSLLAKNIELTEAQQALARKVEELDVLFRLESEIASAIRTEDILTRLLRRVVDMLGCEAGSILLTSEDTPDLLFVSAVGGREEEVRHLRLPRGAGVAGWVAEHGEPAVVPDPSADPRHLKRIEEDLKFPARNILAVPLQLGEVTLGTLELLNKREGAFGDDDLKLATLIAGRAVVAIEVGKQRGEREKADRLSSIGQALSGVIHDFRTPMTIISGYVQLMALENDPERRREHSEIILRQFDFINDMTRELLAFARGESALLLRKVYTERLFLDMRELLTRELIPSQVELKIDNRYPGAIRLDEIKIRRVIFNLARNARQAMPEGGTFTIRVEDAGERVRFIFADTGCGIPEEIRGRLFQSFVTAGKKDGTGLGLAVVKKIVAEHDGTIEVQSQPNQGTTFTITLPKRLDS